VPGGLQWYKVYISVSYAYCPLPNRNQTFLTNLIFSEKTRYSASVTLGGTWCQWTMVSHRMHAAIMHPWQGHSDRWRAMSWCTDNLPVLSGQKPLTVYGWLTVRAGNERTTRNRPGKLSPTRAVRGLYKLAAHRLMMYWHVHQERPLHFLFLHFLILHSDVWKYQMIFAV
jgi:hypothetical protein